MYIIITEVVLYTAVWLSQRQSLLKSFCTLLYACHNYVYWSHFVHCRMDVTIMVIHFVHCCMHVTTMVIEVILYTAVWMSQLWLIMAFCTLRYRSHNYVYWKRFVHYYIDVTTMFTEVVLYIVVQMLQLYSLKVFCTLLYRCHN